MPYTFVISDESLNCYGFRVLTSGIDLEQFKKNPLMLWMHIRSDRFNSSDILPIGTWENIRVEGDKLMADAVFDEKDPFAMKIKGKVDAGIIKMASPGFDVVETTMEAEYLLAGQTKETVSKSKFVEGSLVDIGGNDNALRLYDKDGKTINLAAETSQSFIPLLNTKPIIQTNTLNMKNIAIKLGLPETASEADILMAIEKMSLAKKSAEDKNSELSGAVEEAKTAKATTLVDAAIAAKKLSADKKEAFVKMAKEYFDTAKSMIDAMPAIAKPGDIINRTTAGGPGTQGEEKTQ